MWKHLNDVFTKIGWKWYVAGTITPAALKQELELELPTPPDERGNGPQNRFCMHEMGPGTLRLQKIAGPGPAFQRFHCLLGNFASFT
jgi:hypothetical protein